MSFFLSGKLQIQTEQMLLQFFPHSRGISIVAVILRMLSGRLSVYQWFCRWLGIDILLLLLVATVNGTDSAAQCDNPQTFITPLADYDVRKDRGGLNGMCEAAEGMRLDIVRDRFPYNFAVEQAKLW